MTCLVPSGMAVATTDSASSYLSEYDAAEWTLLAGPDLLDGVSGNLYMVWGRTPDDLSLFFTDNTDTIPGYHFDGESLTQMDLPCSEDDCTGNHVTAIDGAEEHGHGFYIAGNRSEGTHSGFVWHSEDGIHWTEIEVPHPPDPESYDEYFHDVWISDQGEVYVVGVRVYPDPDSEGNNFIYPALLRFDGEEWAEVEAPPHPESDDGEAEFYGVWGMDGEVFTVGCYIKWGGQHFAILHYGPE
jgi:hypothetical protein